MYQLIYAQQVILKDIPKLSEPVKDLIKSTIEKKLLADPVKFGKPLKYSLKGCRSLRVGNYRIIYQLSDKTIKILVCYDQT